MTIDNDFKEAIVSRDLQKVREIGERGKHNILEEMVLESKKADGSLASWIVENFFMMYKGKRLTVDDVVNDTLYLHMTRDSESSKTEVEKLKKIHKIKDWQIEAAALARLADRRFIGYMYGSNYIKFADNFLIKPEKQKKLHTFAATMFMWDNTPYTSPIDVRNIMDHYKLTRQDIEANPSSESPLGDHEFYAALRGFIKKKVETHEQYEELLNTLPEFKDKIQEFFSSKSQSK